MELICFTQSSYVKDEAEKLTSLFHAGLKTLHIRKKNTSKRRLRGLLNKIPQQFHSKIVIHHAYTLCLSYNLKGIHLTRVALKSKFLLLIIKFLCILRPKIILTRSVHTLDELVVSGAFKYAYVFLSPVFESISKKDHLSAFKPGVIKKMLPKSKCPVFALGGVMPDKIKTAHKLGFKGVAALGYLWEKDNTYLHNFNILTEASKPIHLT